ncbi:hypothetical protein [Ponticaulis profundi]|uniref:Porin domain-containing protein n=1 Tax=Ponticaulis profundi TaxID=2665222 RepID=A0ABW1S980_9PROT
MNGDIGGVDIAVNAAVAYNTWTWMVAVLYQDDTAGFLKFGIGGAAWQTAEQLDTTSYGIGRFVLGARDDAQNAFDGDMAFWGVWQGDTPAEGDITHASNVATYDAVHDYLSEFLQL